MRGGAVTGAVVDGTVAVAVVDAIITSLSAVRGCMWVSVSWAMRDMARRRAAAICGDETRGDVNEMR